MIFSSCLTSESVTVLEMQPNTMMALGCRAGLYWNANLHNTRLSPETHTHFHKALSRNTHASSVCAQIFCALYNTTQGPLHKTHTLHQFVHIYSVLCTTQGPLQKHTHFISLCTDSLCSVQHNTTQGPLHKTHTLHQILCTLHNTTV